KFKINENQKPQLLKIDEKVQGEQIKFLNMTRKKRDNDEVEKRLAVLKRAAGGSDNLMPYILDAVKAYASVGEICNTMRTVFGEYKEKVVI
ncbi:MAG TPA: methylmalonyl-CoA mutase family protein, partial [Ignavibacteriaceae bacterium]|nr:methylmalonyl-CoA mutase family protein [Ignavibacteriaceae bacterium]